MVLDFRLSPDLDAAALASRFARDGRVSIDNVLPDDVARQLHAELSSREDHQ